MIAIALTVGWLALGRLFGLACAAKLTDPAATRQATRDLGVPDTLTRAAGIALTVVEGLIATALTIPATARFGAAAAAALLATFIAVATVRMRAGHRVACRCFGPFIAGHSGWRLIGRNVALTAIAVAVAATGIDRIPFDGWSVGVNLSTAVLLAWPGLLACAVLWPALIAAGRTLASRQRAIAELRATAAGTSAMAARRYTIDGGLPLGSRAPDPPLMTPDGQLVTLRPTPGRGLLVLFLESGCPPCERMMPAVARWQRDECPSSLDVALVCGEQASTAADIVRRHGLVDTYAQPDRLAARAYGIPGTPSGVVIDDAGRIAVPHAGGYDAVHALLQRLSTPTPELGGQAAEVRR